MLLNKLLWALCLQSFAIASLSAAEVFFVSPKDGDKVKSPVKLVFDARDVSIVPAGTDTDGLSGHHHLLVNADLPALDKPMGTEVMHFGKGQTETELELAPGKHRLQLILGDKVHQPHQPAVLSKPIVIEVLE